MSDTYTPTAHVTHDADGYHVRTTWSGPNLDRTDGIGYGLGPNHKRLAERLADAINAGAVFYNTELRTDVYGNTYVGAERRVMGKYANADLKRLGY